MSTRFKINYNDFNEDASPIKSDVNIKTSHRQLVANAQTSERNKNIKFRQKVSSGLKKYFGNAKERFFDNVKKQSNHCWIYPKSWIMDDNGNQLLPKNYSAIIHKLKFPSGCITNTCGNKKCVNPKHLRDYPKEEQALYARSKIKKVIGDKHYNSKLLQKDIKNIKKQFAKLLKERSGKSKGIATLINKDYPYVSLPTIINAIKK